MPLPLAAGEVVFGVALGVVVLGAFVFGEAVLGAAFCSGAVLGVCGEVAGVWGDVPGVCGVVLGVSGAVLGVDACDPEVWPLCWSELGPDGDVLFGCVWAATQMAETSNNENSIDLDLMAV
jgi:hypothetical protein